MFDLNYFTEEIADPRSKNLWLMSSPTVPISICLGYAYLVYKYIPEYMKNRPAYDLKIILQYYNLMQIIVNAFIVYGVLTSGWTTNYNLLCQPIDYSNSPMALRMLFFVHVCMLLKLVDFLETIFFILRKKYNQVTTLHVYHHISTFLFSWVAVKYIGGGAMTFFYIINCSVHCLMYFYYYLSSFGPEMQKKLAKWKPRLTQIQLIQFAIITLYALQGSRPSCNTPKIMAIFFLPNMYFISKMFWDFYRKSYVVKK